MTPTFLRAIAATLSFEGEKYVEDPHPSRFGLSSTFLLEKLGSRAPNPKDLTLEQAVDIYCTYIWRPHRFEEFSNRDVACKVFDMCVNFGEQAGVILLQKALNDVLHGTVPPLIEDGVVGDATLAAIDDELVQPWILSRLIALCHLRYEDIIARRPEKKKYEAGWLRRAQYDPSACRP